MVLRPGGLVSGICKQLEGEATFSSSIALLALLRSCDAIRSTSSSSIENLRFSPLVDPPPSSTCALLFRRCESRPAWVSSNSCTARLCSSRPLLAWSSWASRSSCSLALSNRLISFFWARMLLRAHSRQKMSPWMQATGSMAGSRQRQHEPKGRKDSRERRAVPLPQAWRASVRSWDVKTARLVFLLPVTLEESWVWGGRGGLTVRHSGGGVVLVMEFGYRPCLETVSIRIQIDRHKVSRWSISWSFCGALWAVTWLAVLFLATILASSIQRPLSLVQHLPFRGFSTAFHSHPLLHIFRWQMGYAAQG